MESKAFLVHFTRAVYAMNWFNIAPGLYYISTDFGVKIAVLGVLTSAFYLGVALFQLPAGALASRYGNRLVGGMGILILGISAFASGFSHHIAVLSALRFLQGLGSAFFFSPAISTLKTVVSEGKYGFHVNIFNGSFNVGAGLGVLIWNYIDLWMGWRIGFEIAGAITILTGFIYLFGLRGAEESTRRGIDLLSNLKKIVKLRSIWILSLGGMAMMITEVVVAQLLVYYLETAFNFTEFQAMMADTLFLLVGFIGGILGGLIVKRYGVSRKLYAGINAVLALLVIPLAVADNVAVIYVISIIMGIITVQAFSLIYVMIGESQKDKSMVAFSLSLVNFIQVGLGSLWPTVFGIIHDASNYAIAWVSMGAIGLVFIPLLYFLRTRNFRASRNVA